jgi:hypothetical protein
MQDRGVLIERRGLLVLLRYRRECCEKKEARSCQREAFPFLLDRHGKNFTAHDPKLLRKKFERTQMSPASFSP